MVSAAPEPVPRGLPEPRTVPADGQTEMMEGLLDLLRGRPLSPTMIVSVYVPVDEDERAADAAALRFLAAIAPQLRAATASGGIHG